VLEQSAQFVLWEVFRFARSTSCVGSCVMQLWRLPFMRVVSRNYTRRTSCRPFMTRT
jgi:hypothetical protein